MQNSSCGDDVFERNGRKKARKEKNQTWIIKRAGKCGKSADLEEQILKEMEKQGLKQFGHVKLLEKQRLKQSGRIKQLEKQRLKQFGRIK